ncbi:MAG TPA: response regulator [Chloroflexaceae bacterium]|nr:response regulator [Chloroflexaceae bacterium]
MRVLYVEDNAVDADLARRACARGKVRVELEVVATWHEAMERLAAPHYELVLTDINLPDGDGMRLLDHIRSRGLPIAVVVITGLDEEEAAVAALRAGADDFVIKREGYLERLPALLGDALARSKLLLAHPPERVRALALGLGPAELAQIRRHLDRYAPHITLDAAPAQRDRLAALGDGEPAYNVVLAGDYGSPLGGLETLKLVRHGLGLSLPVVILADPGLADFALQAIRLGAAEYLVRHAGYLAHLPAILEKCYGEARRERLVLELRTANASLELAYDSTLDGWARALELRDHETEGHSRRVTDLTLRMAEAAGLGPAELPHVRRGALLHDIGKMGVPDSILRKPGPLTADEWALMRMHPTFAYELLSPIPFLAPALAIPWCHHERWDGAGYPRGLAGEAIPLQARLFAVVDVWDAVTSPRPYRPALAQADAMAIVTGGAGSQFDPHAVELFLRLRPWEDGEL